MISEYDLISQLYDPKKHRIATPVNNRYECSICRKYHAHAFDCPKATEEQRKANYETVKRSEEFARAKAGRYLDQLRLAHGKVVMLKHELSLLRKKLNAKTNINK